MRKRTVILFVAINFLFICAIGSVAKVITDFSHTAGNFQNGVRLEIDRCRGTVYDCNLSPITNSTYKYFVAVPSKSGYPALKQVDETFSSSTLNIFKVPVYNENQLCNHIVGYLGADGLGACGIEKAYDKYLRSGSLFVRFSSTPKGKVLSGKKAVVINENYNYQKGIVLSIDKSVQRVVNSAVNKMINKGAVVVLDVTSGQIKGLSSAPDFDINNLEKSLDDKNSPFINRALSPYNVGSVFKLCVGAAALKNGAQLKYNCSGRIKVGDRYFHCQNQKAHGYIDFEDALSLSCNCYFITLGQKVGAQEVYNMMKSFGFGVKTKIAKDMFSSKGTLPSRADVYNNPSALANLCIGQGELTATPLQIASMIQCIANDGALISPKLVLGKRTKAGKFIKEKPTAPTYILGREVCAKLKSAMIKTVGSGTGKSAKPERFGAGGKTATAQTWKEDVNTTWFAGFFPEQNPRYAVAVLAENGVSGGQSAAPVFKYIADNLK